jgi:hypothetical protein
MAKYNQSTTEPAESWVRAYRIEIDNSYKELPKIFFAEEQVYEFLDGSHINKPLNHGNANAFPMAEFNPDNANSTFQIVNRDTGEPIQGKTASYQEVYDILYSLYLHVAQERDARVEELTANGALNYDPRGYVPRIFYPQ